MKNNKKATFTKPELSVEELSQALYRSNRELLQLNTKLKESEELRSEVFGNISHDLRSPLTSLRGYIDYLLAFPDINSDELELTLNQMNLKLKTIEQMMEQLLAFELIKSASQENNFVYVQADIFLKEIFSSYAFDRKFSTRNLKLDISDNVIGFIRINTQDFQRVLDNLFINAFKYTKEGSTIQLSASKTNDALLITISDNGIGIDAEFHSKIFDRTFMVSTARTASKEKGFGLGLSIVQAIVQQHDGQIWCDSKLGEGSTFFINMPLFDMNNNINKRELYNE